MFQVPGFCRKLSQTKNDFSVRTSANSVRMNGASLLRHEILVLFVLLLTILDPSVKTVNDFGVQKEARSAAEPSCAP